MGTDLGIPGDVVDRMPASQRFALAARQEAGLPVRWVDEGDLYAGKCGGETVQGDPCRRNAGDGTKHKGWGRCWEHEGSERGLAPWFGLVVETPLRTHGASALQRSSLIEIFGQYLEPDERAVLEGAAKDPVELLTAVMGVRTAALLRIERWLANQRREKNAVTDRNIIAAESSADRTAQVIARLAEVRKGYLELARGEDTHRTVKEVLAGLSDSDFARLKSDPKAMALLLGTSLGE